MGDVRHAELGTPAVPHIYLSHDQEPWGSLSVVIRTAGAPLLVASAVREHVRALDPNLPATLRSMEDVLDASLDRPRFYTILLGLFGGIALALSAVGIFAVVSYTAASRTREIGVRLALGAERREVIRLIVHQGLRPVAGGMLVGFAGASAATHFLAPLLYDVEPKDPLTFLLAAGFLGLVALAACWIPAARAAGLDPLTALRAE